MAQAVWYSISHFSSVGVNPINAVNWCLRLTFWTSRRTHSLLMKKCFPSQTENNARTQLEPHETFPADLLHIPSWVIVLSVLKTELKLHLCVLRELRRHSGLLKRWVLEMFCQAPPTPYRCIDLNQSDIGLLIHIFDLGIKRGPALQLHLQKIRILSPCTNTRALHR